MKWRLKTSTDKTIELDVELSDTIGDVKFKVQVQKGICVEQQHFVCAGALLEDRRVLNEIIDLDEVELILRLPEAAVSMDNFRQHRLFTSNVIMCKHGEPLDPPAAGSLVIGDRSNMHHYLGRGAFGMVVRGIATHPPIAASTPPAALSSPPQPPTRTPPEASAAPTLPPAAGESDGGDGGGGAAASPTVVGQPVAVKMVHKINNPNLYGMFSPNGPVWDFTIKELMAELNSLLSLQHPHVVRVHCFGLQRLLGVAVPGLIALRLCSEGTLEDWIEGERFGDTGCKQTLTS